MQCHSFVQHLYTAQRVLSSVAQLILLAKRRLLGNWVKSMLGIR